MSEALHAYLPIDRRHALARGGDLPSAVHGSALEADLSGFTALTEVLGRMHGEQRGAEELSRRLNVLFDGLVREVHRYGGTVLGFSGDAFTCWLDGDDGLRAAACAVDLQRWMAEIGVTLGEPDAPLGLKVAVATGSTKRFLVGDPSVQLIEGLAGKLVDEVVAAEHLAVAGEVVLARSTVESLGARATVEPREDAGILLGLTVEAGDLPWPALEAEDEERMRRWVLRGVFERLAAGQGDFLAELRPAVALFLRFPGIDFEHDPDALDRLDTFVRAVQGVLSSYEGTLVQLTIGDKGSYLYAAFGAPVAHEDDAVRALAAALELRELGGAGRLVDPVSIGVASGRLRAGAYGGVERRTYGVLGDAVNLAARLMQAAGPGEVVAGSYVRQAAGPGFRWTEMPPLTVKGKSAPVAIARLAGRARRRAQARTAGSELIGRQLELARLREAFERAASGRGRVAGVVGEAGLGKSRVVSELLTGTRGRGVRDHFGECTSFGVRGSYVVWQPIWRSLLGIGGSGARGRAAAAAQLERLGGAAVPRLPLLGPVLGLDISDNDLTASLDGKVRKTSLEATLSDWLRVAVVEPTILVLDDCHWIDQLSEDLLEAVARAARELPLLIVLTYRRRALADGGPLSVAALPHFDEIPLAPLSDTEMDALIRQRLGGEGELEASLVDRLAARAEGNPFYVEELLNYLRSDGDGRIDTARLAELPSSLQSLVLSRIDRLAEHPRATLKVASAFGRTFPAPLLPPVHPVLGGDEEVRPSLEVLDREDFVHAEDETVHSYAFKHAVTQEVSYSTISAQTRASLHGRIGRVLEERAGDDAEQQLDLLAHHFGLSDDEGRKRAYLLRAGESARSRYATDAAIEYYGLVLPLLGGAERLDVLMKIGKTQELAGRWGDAATSFEQALELARSLGDRPAEARARAAQAELLRKRGSFAEAATVFAEARTAFEQAGDDGGVAEVLHVTGTLAAQQGDLQLARERYQAALALRNEIGDRRGAAASLNGLAIVAEYEGGLEAAGRLFEEALAILTELDDRWAIAALTNNLGNTLLQVGRAEEARPVLDRAVALEREIGDPQMLANFLCNLANAERDTGRGPEALGAYRESLLLSRELGDRWLVAYLLEDLAALLAEAEPSQAVTLAAAGARLREEIGSPRPPASLADLEERLRPARTRLPAEEVEAAAAAGRALPFEEAVAAALAVNLW